MLDSPAPHEPVEIQVPAEEDGKRLDAFLAAQFRYYSRTQLRHAIRDEGVTVDGEPVKAAYRVRCGQKIVVRLPARPRERPIPEQIPLHILFEDEYLAAINKQPGMVVHPARGHWSGTLTSALTYHFDNLSQVGGAARPGIVHRLDRDTSGVIVVAKTDRAHMGLTAQFEDRSTEKEYLAIVYGSPDRDRDVIERPIGAHPYQREKMAIRADHATSREARTFYEVQERFDRFALLRIAPTTGRTHQIRVHLAHIRCPVLCDRLYSGRSQITREELEGAPIPTRSISDGAPISTRSVSEGAPISTRSVSEGASEGTNVVLNRQALHAWRLKIKHPVTGEPLTFEAPLLDDMQQVLDILRHRPTTRKKAT